jgi:hypothetical protein
VIAPAVLAPLLLGGAAYLLKRKGMLVEIFQRVFDGERESLRRARNLARSIMGNDKHSVAAVLGPPEASSGSGSLRAVFLADTWYYRLDSQYRIAIAIEFVKDIASDVRVLQLRSEPGVRGSAAKRSVVV